MTQPEQQRGADRHHLGAAARRFSGLAMPPQAAVRAPGRWAPAGWDAAGGSVARRATCCWVIVLVGRVGPPSTPPQMLRFQCQKTNDPIERYDKVLELLSAADFQYPKTFSDEMTALFGPASELPATLLHLGRCVLEFEQFTEAYACRATVTELPRKATPSSRPPTGTTTCSTRTCPRRSASWASSRTGRTPARGGRKPDAAQ